MPERWSSPTYPREDFHNGTLRSSGWNYYSSRTPSLVYEAMNSSPLLSMGLEKILETPSCRWGMSMVIKVKEPQAWYCFADFQSPYPVPLSDMVILYCKKECYKNPSMNAPRSMGLALPPLCACHTHRVLVWLAIMELRRETPPSGK